QHNILYSLISSTTTQPASNLGIQPQQVSHRSRIVWTTARTNRRDVLAENQQVGPRIRRHRNADRAEDSRQHRIEEEIRKLRVVLDRKSTRLNSSHQIISYAVF